MKYQWEYRPSRPVYTASIPMALDHMRTAGRIRSGETALLVGFGAGLSYAGQVVRIP